VDLSGPISKGKEGRRKGKEGEGKGREGERGGD